MGCSCNLFRRINHFFKVATSSYYLIVKFVERKDGSAGNKGHKSSLIIALGVFNFSKS